VPRRKSESRPHRRAARYRGARQWSGGNITGFTLIEFEIIGKWLGLLKEMAPRVNRAKLLFNPVTAPFFAVWMRDLGTLSVASIELEAAPVHDRAGIEATISMLAREPAAGLITAADVFTVANRSLIIGLAERYGCRRCINSGSSPWKAA
jgi:putative ABC transport system substrate-binding protein